MATTKLRASEQLYFDNHINLNSKKITNLADAVNPQDAVTKAQLDAAVIGLLDDRGNYDASSNVFPSSGGSGISGAIMKGDIWIISVAGTLGGTTVQAGDSIRALVDNPGQTASNWGVLSSGSALGYTAENVINKVTSWSSTPNNTNYPSEKLVKDTLDTKADAAALSSKLEISNYICRETPSGSKNGSNTNFTLAYAPIAGTEMVFVNGMLMNAGSGNDYTIASNTISFAVPPISSDVILVTYWK